MREAGRIVADVLDALEQAVAPGITTWELDALAEKMTAERGARPAFKGYLGFPCVLCASINDEVVHGIPSRKRKLVEGDLMKLDFGVSYRGWFGDSARTVPVGKVSPEARSLVETTRESLQKAIQAMKPGNRLGGTLAMPSSGTWRRGGSPWSGISRATGLAASSTSTHTCPTTGRQGRG
nr:M24 family metallopeptidase [Myxococcus sp. AS-1-15]